MPFEAEAVHTIIASEAKQSSDVPVALDCFVGDASSQ
jgi:hypothetical protein